MARKGLGNPQTERINREEKTKGVNRSEGYGSQKPGENRFSLPKL